MDHESQSLKPAFVTDHCIRENCPKCVHLQRRYCVYLCAMCAVFAFINMVVPIYILGQQNANAESDILNQLHVLQARIENLEAINNRGLSVATELHDDVSYYLKRVFYLPSQYLLMNCQKICEA